MHKLGAGPRSQPVALIRVAWLIPVVSFLRSIGAPVEQLLARAHLSGSMFDDPEDLLSVSQALGFMEESARMSGVGNLGLLAGHHASIDALGVFGHLIHRSRTVHDAIQTAMNTLAVVSSGGHGWLVHDGDRVRLGHRFVDGLADTHWQADDYSLMLALNVLRLAAGPRWRRDDVVLETTRTDGLRDPDVVPDARIVFRQREPALTFPQSLLTRPLVRTAAARQIGDRDIEAWRASGPAGDFPLSVLQVIATLSSSDCPRIGVTASAIGTSIRALQRRLAEGGLSYGRLVAQARFDTAVHLLQGTDATVLDIALDLGYSDHAHFTRAFRRWTGVAPREFRRASRRETRTSPLTSPSPTSRTVAPNLRSGSSLPLAWRG